MLKDILTKNGKLNGELNGSDLTFIKKLIYGDHTTSEKMVQNPVNCCLIQCKLYTI